MINKKEYYNLGLISKVFSFKGEIIARIDVETPNLYTDLKTIFIEFRDNLTPYFIEYIEPQRAGFAKIKFKGIDTQEAANNIVRCPLYLPDALLPKLGDDEFYFHELEGFTIYNEENEIIGTVKQIYDLPSNPIIETIIDEKEILIPLNLMLEFDKKEKILVVEIPDGLIDVYK